MKRQYPKTLLIVLLGMVFTHQSWAFQKENPFSLENPRSFAREAIYTGSDDRVGLLAPSRLEVINKTNLIELKLKDPKKFDQIRADRLENSLLYQSWVDEVNEALAGRRAPSKVTTVKREDLYQRFFLGTPIDLAKRIAIKEMYLTVQRNWPWLKNSIFNEFDTDTWKRKPVIHSPEAPLQTETPGGSDLTVQKINELFHFSPRLSTDKFYVFSFEFGGPNFVEINKKTLQSGRVAGRVGLDIGSGHDVNRLEDGADKITADESQDNTNKTVSSKHSDDSSDSTNSPDNNAPMNSPNDYMPPAGNPSDTAF